jgi:protein-S-isoprenylcysteine O-methyltransferase Ste14
MAKRLKRWLLATLMIGGLVFVLAGTWRDPWLWAYVAVWSGSAAYGLLSLDEDLAQERFRPPTAGADRIAVRILRVVALSHIIVGALDTGRWHLTASVPSGVRAVAMTGMAAGVCMFYRAMHENRFFSAVVRVQAERGHRVIDSGPYAIVRHPGYAGLILVPLFSGLALGSWLAVAVGLMMSALVVRRVVFEDSFLSKNLDGYAAYTRRVPHRLIPGVW